MSDNPFDDLEGDETVAESTTDGEATASERVDTEPDQPQSVEPASAEPDSPADAGPGFEYSEVRQRPLYARGETWDELEDELGIRVVPSLRRLGIRDEETRELHDAILKVAIDHIDEVPERVRETRTR
ncbi:hypothetical protein [Natrarchaeobius oligotrophus]|uniref:Uncharacterized protein n=1 Tax=Natrarchaeobius chitinivorans TaxID=1679083 RepID=A0A3N6NJ51_NATCH|nr:hypothetical protein [Natrarchaeobius chitinivorans]RQG99182.1 hypothetical protein EA472_15030 [Natrarchaeobius chitinivorans]